MNKDIQLKSRELITVIVRMVWTFKAYDKHIYQFQEQTQTELNQSGQLF